MYLFSTFGLLTHFLPQFSAIASEIFQFSKKKFRIFQAKSIISHHCPLSIPPPPPPPRVHQVFRFSDVFTENIRKLDVFRGYRKRPVVWKWLILPRRILDFKIKICLSHLDWCCVKLKIHTLLNVYFARFGKNTEHFREGYVTYQNLLVPANMILSWYFDILSIEQSK